MPSSRQQAGRQHDQAKIGLGQRNQIARRPPNRGFGALPPADWFIAAPRPPTEDRPRPRTGVPSGRLKPPSMTTGSPGSKIGPRNDRPRAVRGDRSRVELHHFSLAHHQQQRAFAQIDQGHRRHDQLVDPTMDHNRHRQCLADGDAPVGVIDQHANRQVAGLRIDHPPDRSDLAHDARRGRSSASAGVVWLGGWLLGGLVWLRRLRRRRPALPPWLGMSAGSAVDCGVEPPISSRTACPTLTRAADCGGNQTTTLSCRVSTISPIAVPAATVCPG